METTFSPLSESPLPGKYRGQATMVNSERQLFAVKSGKIIETLAVLLFAASPAFAQDAGRSESTARLEVTATVVGSVGVVLAPNGDLKVVVANAPDAAFLAEEALVLSKKYRKEKPGVREASPDQIKKGTKLPGLVPFPISTDETCLLH